MKHRIIPYLFLTLLISFSACKKEKTAVVNPDLTIGYFPSSDMLPFCLAEQKGYFDSLKVKIRFIRLESKIQRDTLYRKGKLDGCLLDLTDAIKMSADGNRIFPVMANEGCFYLIGNPDSSVLHIKDLNNKNVAVANYAASHYLVDKLTQDLRYSKDDVNKPAIDDENIRLSMLLNSQIDAGIFRDPFATEAVRNKAIKLYSCNNLNLITTVTAFSQQALDKKKEHVQKLVKGYNRGVEYMNAHPVREWYRSVADSIGLPHWKAPVKIARYHQARVIPQADADSVTVWMKQYELIPQKYIADIIDRSILKENLNTDSKQSVKK